MSVASTIPIDKLRGVGDWNNWKFSIKMLLMHEDLHECIETADGSKDAKKNQKALAKICLSVHNNVIQYVRGAKTPYEAWSNLQKAFEDKGLTRRLGLLRSLFSTKLGESMDSYLSKITDVSQQLSDIGFPLTDDFIAVLMLSGLTSDYDPLIMALENSNTKLESEVVKSKLLQESQRRDDKCGDLQHETALVTRKVPKCFRCKKAGHFKKDCPRNESNDKKFFKKTRSGNPEMGLVSALSVGLQSDVWYVDSGATNHMCNDKSVMCDFKEIEPIKVSVANGEELHSVGYGHVKVQMKNCVKMINNVYYVPKLSFSLLSVSEMTRKGYKVVFDEKQCQVFDESKIVAKATYINGVYRLDTLGYALSCSTGVDSAMDSQQVKNCGSGESLEQIGSSTVTQEVWHRRLGHLNTRSMALMQKGMVFGISYTNDNFKTCISCIEGKQTKLPFPKKSFNRSEEVLGLIHTDLCGPMPVKSFGDARYFLTFIDDCSRKTFVYFLKSKDEVFENFKNFKKLVENETNKHIKCLRSDNGGEYINGMFQGFLKKHGIRHQTTIPHSSEQNGVAERANRTIVEKARCMLQDSGLDKRFWAEAVNTAVYLKNISPTKAVIGKTPEEKWSNKKVNVNHLRIFGCVAYALQTSRKKLDSRTKAYIFVGYCDNSKGFRLMDPMSPGMCIKARNVTFIEDRFWKNTGSLSDDDNMVYIPINNLTNGIENTVTRNEQEFFLSEDIPSCSDDKQKRKRRETIFTVNESHDYSDSSDETYIPGPSSIDSEDSNAFEDEASSWFAGAAFREADEPETVQEALNSPEAKHWKKAMRDEYSSFITNKCWTLVEPQKDQKPVKCKWVFKKKRSLDGQIVRYKARLVAKGYTQSYGIDYHETFSPVVRYSTIRLLLALAAQYNLGIELLDVETAFLNGDLKEHVLMEQPDGFKARGEEHKVYKLHKAVYGLKQSAKSWNEKINGVLLNKLQFKRMASEPCVYYKGQGEDLIIIALYVDDIILFSSPSSSEKTVIKQKLMKEFKIKDLGPAHQILGMKISRNKQVIRLDQTSYIERVLKKFNMFDCKSVNTPMETGLKLIKGDEKDSKYDYRNLVGCLMYIAVCSRPDIAHAVSVLSQFNECYTEVHWKAAKRVLRYLKGTSHNSLTFRKGCLDINGYADADWAGNEVDRRSYTGYVFMLGHSIVSWESRKQKTVALSSTEAEYMALSDACKEAMFLQSFLSELGVTCKVNICNDNQSALKLCTNSMYHSRTKHIDVKHHFIRDAVEKNIVNIRYLCTDEMVADILTKPLSKEKHLKLLHLCTYQN